jgi:lipopolysaccharide export system protein LptA
MLFRKITISQGGMSVSADQAQVTGTKLDFDNSRWVFRGNVKITMDQGLLTADHAEVTFANKLLAAAVADGKPAEFEQRVAKSGKLAHGHAELIEYDVARGTVKLSKDAYLSDGPNDMHGESLKYNILEQKVVADAPDQNSQRVHITITPPAAAAPKP